MQDERTIDPFSRIRYKDAFNQEDLHKRYATLMRQLGCHSNVFDDGSNVNISSVLSDYDPRNSSYSAYYYNKTLQLARALCRYACRFIPSTQPAEAVKRDGHFDHDACQAYLDECHSRLAWARRRAIARPIAEQGSFMVLFACAAGVMKALLPADGGALGMSLIFMNMAHLSKEPLRAAYQLLSSPKNDLEDLEDRFAANQCFIPKALWPKIIDQFGMARSNQYEQQKCIDFIKFALDLTVYAPKPSIGGGIDVDNVKQELEHRIDKFFADYQITVATECDYRDSINNIKIQVKKFIDALLCNGHVTNPPKYLYLQGQPGIGKTYFIGQQLKDWILELIPNSVHYEELAVHSAEELEGSAKMPGVMLSCLRHQLASGKRGTVMFMDEATCLHQQSMLDTCKRVFNGKQSKISTVYFGNGSEGQGIAMDMPPMLTCVAGNDSIEHKPLRDRFKVVHFPLPKKEKLVQYAIEKAQESETFRKHPIDCNVLLPVVSQWIDDNKINNFRQADDVETFLRSEKAAQAIQQLIHT